MASRVRAVDNHAQRFGDALLLAGPAPELGDRAFERQANLSFAVRVSLEINHADFLLEAAALLHEKHGISEDRKSTRLNSSHLGISYAVFCLKKKKIDN